MFLLTSHFFNQSVRNPHLSATVRRSYTLFNEPGSSRRAWASVRELQAPSTTSQGQWGRGGRQVARMIRSKDCDRENDEASGNAASTFPPCNPCCGSLCFMAMTWLVYGDSQDNSRLLLQWGGDIESMAVIVTLSHPLQLLSWSWHQLLYLNFLLILAHVLCHASRSLILPPSSLHWLPPIWNLP